MNRGTIAIYLFFVDYFGVALLILREHDQSYDFYHRLGRLVGEAITDMSSSLKSLWVVTLNITCT